ncbi:MAG: hypothetical protein JW984_16160 [Deltaproteobacteria bacterium]|uniref:Uncharacterized protein n=1 Tax=Candidatus Zymogenus saltonus TaxID=2844893 RepID=A0A9D8KH87_9DELT|nr:hypothetical protein [Candidatus Zymogenus saltonus]
MEKREYILNDLRVGLISKELAQRKLNEIEEDKKMENEKKENPAKEEKAFLVGRGDLEGESFIFQENPALRNVRLKICCRPELLGADRRWYLKATGGTFGHEHIFISDMIPISMDGRYRIEYEKTKYEMKISEKDFALDGPVSAEVEIEKMEGK